MAAQAEGLIPPVPNHGMWAGDCAASCGIVCGCVVESLRACHRGKTMLHPKLIGGIALAALAILISGAQAFEEAKYPDLTGQWRRRATHTFRSARRTIS